MNAQRLEIAGLSTQVVGRDDARLTAVLLHGYGASGDDLVGLAPYLNRSAGGAIRFVFPEAPLELPGMYGDARAWWHIDLARLESALRSGDARGRMAEVPDGLVSARQKVSALIDEVIARYGVAEDRVVLGGFSQGAMLSVDVAVHRAGRLAALALLSGTLIAEPEWSPRFAQLAGVPVFQSHGRADPLLPFAIAETLHDQLTAAGAKVEWHAFDGGHQIPQAELDALGAFLRARL